MKKRIIISAIAIVLFAACALTTFGIVRSSDKKAALSSAKAYVPEAAALIGTHVTDGAYEFAFASEATSETYIVNFSRELKAVKQVRMIADDINGATEATLTEEDVKNVVITAHPTAKVTACKLVTDAQRYIYSAEYEATECYGDMEIHAANGRVLTSNMKIGTPIVIPIVSEGDTYLTEAEVTEIALAKVNGGVIVGIDFEYENGLYIYEIDIRHNNIEYELIIDAKTGAELYFSTVTDDDMEPIITDNADFIGVEAAKEIALAKAEGKNARIVEIHLDNEDGIAVYEGDMVDDTYEYDFDINAISGEVLTWEKEALDDENETPLPTDAQNDYIGLSKAKEIALAKAEGKNAKITEIHLDTEDGIAVYEGEMIDDTYEYDFDINAKNGKIVSWDKEAREGNNTPTPTDGNSDYIGLSKAKKIALAKAEGKNARITEIHLDTEDGIAVYEGEMIDDTYEYDFDINAKNGKIVSWDKEARDNEPHTDSPAPTTAPAESEYIGTSKAKKIALAKAEGDNAEILSIHLENDDGRMVYEGEMRDDRYEYDFDIDAYTGAIVSWEKEAITPAPTNGGNSEYIGYERARELALAKAKGNNARIVEIELDYEDGRAVYEIEMVDDTYEYEITIDAYTGTIIEFDYEREDD